MFKSYCFHASKTGPHILILGAVHGNETAGTFAQQEIIHQIETGALSLKSGSVTFIPIVNERAQRQDTRFVDENLNRIIKYHKTPLTNEQKIANLLIKEIDKADVLLDLHSTHCEKDEAFAFIDYPDEKNLSFLKIIPVQTALAGWPLIYQNNSEIENFCTEEYAHQKNISALTVECGYHKDKKAIEIAKQSILNTLIYYGILDDVSPTPITKKIISLNSFIIKEKNGYLANNFKHLDDIKKGDVLAVYETGEQLYAPVDGFIIMPNHKANINEEWYYIGTKNL